MNYLGLYLICGLVCAMWNDIVIVSNIAERHFKNKSFLCISTARFFVALFVTIFWIPLIIYVIFKLKEYK